MLLRTEASARWRRRAFWAFVLLCVSYGVYAAGTDFTHGGSPAGIAYGLLGTLAFFILLYYGVRKRAYRSKMGTLEGWLQSHVYLGLLSLVLILFHTGFRFEDKVAVSAFAVLAVVVISGLVGAILYTAIPRRLTAAQGDTLPEEAARQIQERERDMVALASSRSPVFQKICQELLNDLRPRPLAGWRLVFRGSAVAPLGREDTALLERYSRLVPDAEQPALRDLLVLVRQRRELHQSLVTQQRHRNLLDAWLWLHLPLSIALVALVAAHLWGAFHYSSLYPDLVRFFQDLSAHARPR
jgi:hypothetical protein